MKHWKVVGGILLSGLMIFTATSAFARGHSYGSRHGQRQSTCVQQRSNTEIGTNARNKFQKRYQTNKATENTGAQNYQKRYRNNQTEAAGQGQQKRYQYKQQNNNTGTDTTTNTLTTDVSQ